MASLEQVFPLVLSYLNLSEGGALASALPNISRLHRGHSASLLAASAASLTSGAWHAGVEGVIGVEEYAAISKACKGAGGSSSGGGSSISSDGAAQGGRGAPEPFDIAQSSGGQTESALVTVLER